MLRTLTRWWRTPLPSAPSTRLGVMTLESRETPTVTSVDASGIWQYDGSQWTNLTTVPAEQIAQNEYGDVLADFGEGGLWLHDDAWQKLSDADPESIDVGYQTVVADFGEAGSWFWDQTQGWQKITDADPDEVGISSAGVVYGDFGLGGLWQWADGNGWVKLSHADAEDIDIDATGSVIASYGIDGVWAWTGAWQKLTGAAAEDVAISNGVVAADFGAGGVWQWDADGGWQKLTDADAVEVQVSTTIHGPAVYGDFGEGGLWVYNAGWLKIDSTAASDIAAR